MFLFLYLPISSLAKKTPIITVANSGAELPAAMKVAPATSGDIFNSKTNWLVYINSSKLLTKKKKLPSHIRSKEATKYSSQTMASPKNVYTATSI